MASAPAGIREGMSGQGTGDHGEELVSAPVTITPPYLPYTFCRRTGP